MSLASYLKDTASELKQVRWPSRQTTFKLTGIVLGISAFVAIYIGLLDYIFTTLLTLVLK